MHQLAGPLFSLELIISGVIPAQMKEKLWEMNDWQSGWCSTKLWVLCVIQQCKTRDPISLPLKILWPWLSLFIFRNFRLFIIKHEYLVTCHSFCMDVLERVIRLGCDSWESYYERGTRWEPFGVCAGPCMCLGWGGSCLLFRTQWVHLGEGQIFMAPSGARL